MRKKRLAKSSSERIALALEESRAIVKSYPRERFGSFALDDDVLAVIDAGLRYLHTNSDESKPESIHEDDAYRQLYVMWRALAEKVVVWDDHWTYHDQAAAQIYFLWFRNPNDPMYRIRGIGSGALGINPNDGVGTILALEWFTRYEFLYDNPAALPYFEAGIFEKDTIRKAITNEIDPSLIASVAA